MPPTVATGCSCWPYTDERTTTLPTPCARDGKGPGHQYGLPDLIERVGLLPTPTAVAYGSNRSLSAGAAVRPSLARLVTDLAPQPPIPPLPTPTVADTGSLANTTPSRTVPQSGHAGRTSTDPVRLLPTPRGTDGAKGCPGQRGSHGDLTLPSAAARVLPTPTSSDANGPGGRRDGGANPQATRVGLPTADPSRWGAYAAAVARWELLLQRPVPEPTQTGTHGKPVLAPPFVEWLMGLPAGWVTGLPLPRTQALRVLGNGVIPQQAAAALRLLLCPHHWATHPDNVVGAG